MKKILLATLVVVSLFTSCSDEKTFTKKDGSTFTAQPYGWGSKEDKIEGVEYKINVPDVVLSVMFSETIITPILITSFDIWEPVSYTEPTK